MDVSVNGAESGVWLLVEHNGALYAPDDAFEEWRMSLKADILPILIKGRKYLPLNAIPGYRAKINLANQSVQLFFSPQAFAATLLTSDTAKRPEASEVLPSLQFSYDLNYSQSQSPNTTTVRDLSALTEIIASSQLGVFSSSSVAHNLTGNTAQGTTPQLLRLETSLTRNFPGSNSTLILGDSSTRAGILGSSVYFGGVQFGTNFSLTPGVLRQPLPTINGSSAAPSTVQLYVNDVLRQVSNVPAGPFAIENSPILTGNGDARIVVTDQLGRQTVIEQSFFSNGQLLRAGLDDWSMAAGKVRLYLGTASNIYGPAFFSGLWRHGINSSLTLEGRTVAAPNLDLLQIGAVSTLPFQLLGRVAIADSHSKDAGNGSQSLLGLEHQGLRFGAQFEMQAWSRTYRELGQDITMAPTKRQLAGNLTYASEKLGVFGLGFANIRVYDSPTIATLSANYSTRVSESCNLNFTVSRAQGQISNTAIGVTLTFLLDRNRVASTYFNKSGNLTDASATYAQNPDPDHPFGWHLLGGQEQNAPQGEGGINYLGRSGNLTGDVSTLSDHTAVRLGATGGLVLADGHVFATPRITGSFAVAEVKDYGDIGVGIGSNMLTKTDANGVALIPNLTAFQSNSIRLDARDLPVSAELDSIERNVVPVWRSGVKVVFPVRSGRGALLKIKFDDGEPAPAGAIVRIVGDKEEFYVARRGEAYVTGLGNAVNQTVLSWNKQQCKIEVTLLPQKGDEIPRLGPLLCKGIAR